MCALTAPAAAPYLLRRSLRATHHRRPVPDEHDPAASDTT